MQLYDHKIQFTTYRTHYRHRLHRTTDSNNDLVAYVDTNDHRRENVQDNIDIQDDLTIYDP
jgi:hypothetical protein